MPLEKPSQGDMMNPSDAQDGAPSYEDKSAETPGGIFYPDRGNDAPAYRYKEYR